MRGRFLVLIGAVMVGLVLIPTAVIAQPSAKELLCHATGSASVPSSRSRSAATRSLRTWPTVTSAARARPQ